jgi:hypothetical protein
MSVLASLDWTRFSFDVLAIEDQVIVQQATE